MKAIQKLCSGVNVDEETGARQPKYRVDGMRIWIEMPKDKNADEEMTSELVSEGKQVRAMLCWGRQMVYLIRVCGEVLNKQALPSDFDLSAGW